MSFVLALFDTIGAPEILVILVLALLVLGPERLPQAARTMGRWVGELRKLTGSLQAEMQDVVDEVMRPVNDTATVATESFTSTFSDPDGEASSYQPAESGRAGTAASPSEVSSEPRPADAGTETLAADVPLRAFPAPPVDPSLN